MGNLIDIREKFRYPEDYLTLGLSSHAGVYVNAEQVESLTKELAKLRTAYDDGEKYCEAVEKQLSIAVSALEKISTPNPRPPESATEYQKMMYWAGHQLDSESIAREAQAQIKAGK